VDQAVQVAGALAILAAFVLAQRGVLEQHSYGYLVPNVVGAAALAVDAYVERQWGFVLLETVWALVSAWGLLARVRGRA
jgi:hypothetical protein